MAPVISELKSICKLEVWESWWCSYSPNSKVLRIRETDSINPGLNQSAQVSEVPVFDGWCQERMGVPAQEQRADLSVLCCFASIQAPKELVTYLHWWALSSLLSLWIQILISSRNCHPDIQEESFTRGLSIP